MQQRDVPSNGSERAEEVVVQPSTLVRAEAPPEEIRVSGRTNVQSLAWTVYKTHEEGKRVVLLGIGTQAINQAVKAVAIANSRGASHGIIFTILPAMQDVVIAGQEGEELERTVIKMTLIPYKF